MTHLVLDFETNGIGTFQPPTQTITQFAWILFDDNGNILKSENDIIKGAKKGRRFFENSLTLDDLNNKGIPLKDAYLKFKSYKAHNTLYGSLCKKSMQHIYMSLKKCSK